MQKNRSLSFLQWYISHYEIMDIQNSAVCFGIFEKGDGRVLGAVGAGEHDDLHEPEIFYNMLPEERGKGYATEAATAVTEWALESYDIPYIIGTTGVDNIASQRVLEHCGYVFIDERHLKMHVTGNSADFKYYRCYRTK